jgi:hypothetical protein
MKENFDEMRKSILGFESTNIPSGVYRDEMIRYISTVTFMKAVTHQLHLMEMEISNGR